jgi:hypothetical protein
MATMAASNVTNTASLRVTKTASCAIDGLSQTTGPWRWVHLVVKLKFISIMSTSAVSTVPPKSRGQ